ncbi:MAG TPA: hypothetical protein VGM67_06205 [Gemmatimonadaceae bacterium]
MRMIWKLVKIALVLAIAIPLGLIVLATTLGVLGALVGLAFLVLKLAMVGLIAFAGFRLVRRLFGSARAPAPSAPVVRELTAVDPYYTAAMRELDAEMGRQE